jgi:hypothetical protein
MESEHDTTSATGRFTLRADRLNDPSQVAADLIELSIAGIELIQAIDYLPQLLLDNRQSTWHIAGPDNRLIATRRPTSFSDRSEMAWMPVERNGERFKRATAAAALHGVVLDLADNCLRNAGALYQVPLTQVQFRQAFVDRPSDRRPVLRHVFLRAPPPHRD